MQDAEGSSLNPIEKVLYTVLYWLLVNDDGQHAAPLPAAPTAVLPGGVVESPLGGIPSSQPFWLEAGLFGGTWLLVFALMRLRRSRISANKST